MTFYTIILGLLIVGFAIIALATLMIWIDSYYEDTDEHANTDDARG